MSFEAKYPGECAYGDRIQPGDHCTYTDDDEIAHSECDAVEVATNIHATICPNCHLDHKGECW